MSSSIPTDRIQDIRDRRSAARDLRTWEELDEKYDARATAARDRQLDEAFGPIGGAR